MIPPARYDVPLIRVLLTDSNGNPVTGIANNDANLRIAICRDSVGSIAVFSGGNILSITTIGAYSDPGSSVQCRWGEVNSTYFPGLYELQFNQSFWAAARASLIVRVYDATGTPRWVQVYAAIPCYMPTRVDHVRDTLQTARDLGAQLDATVSSRAAPGDAMTLTSGERTNVAQAILSQAAVGTLTTSQALGILHAVLAGKAERTANGTRFRNIGDTKWVVTVTHDAVGNRTDVVIDP